MQTSATEPARHFHYERDASYTRGISQILTNAAHQHSDSGIYFTDGNPEEPASFLSYSSLLEEARFILGGLQTRGAQTGGNVVLLLEHPRDFICAFWACTLGGLVSCPLMPIRNDPERWARHVEHVRTLLDDPLILTTQALKRELTGMDEAVDLDTFRQGPAASPIDHVHADAPAILVLTSGSTGNAKAVVLTHANLMASMAGKTERQQMTARDVTLNWISFDHVAALLETHLLPLYAGAAQIHIESAAIITDPLLFLRLIERYRVSMTFAPNFLFGQLNAALHSAGHQVSDILPRRFDLSCLRHIVSGGEAIVVETARRFIELLTPYGLSRRALWPAFGMTETCAGSIYSREFPDHDPNVEFAALGQPIDGFEMRVVDEHDIALPEGAPGELQVRGPMVFSCYYNNEAATRAAFTSDGWFRTGDLGRIDNGRLTLVGRSKDSIIVNGVNYFSHELETALEQLEGVERSYVAAFPTRQNTDATERLVITFATSLPKDDEASLYRLIIAIRNSTVLLWGFRPAMIVPLPKALFPKTSLGKIQRATLRKRVEAGELESYLTEIDALTQRQIGGYVAPVGHTEIVIADIFAQMFGVAPDTISATVSFFDLGGTSLDILKLKRHIESRLGLAELPIVTILKHPTVRGLAARVSSADATHAEPYDPIVPLQLSGSKTPLFCVHPGVGEVLVFVNLAKYFVNERPFYALRARGFNDGESYFTSFDEMVRTYVAAIRRCQPRGPYAIAGYSYGGAVAFEIAKVLESEGEHVAFIGSFNLPPHIKYRMDELDPVEGAVNLAFFLSLIDKQQAETLPAQLRAALPHQDPCAYLIDIAPAQRLAELQIDLDKFKAWAALAQSLLTLGRSYVPSGKVESMSIFYAIPLRGTKDDWLNNELKRWDDFTRGPNRYIDVPGEHYTLMGPKHVATFQAVLRAELERALDGN